MGKKKKNTKKEKEQNQKTKEDGIVVEGIVKKSHPNATFDIELANGHMVLAHISGKMRKHFIRVLPDDQVEVELSPYDLNRGRIIMRQK